MKKLVLISALMLGIIFVLGKANAQSPQSQDKDAKSVTAQTAQKTAGNFIDKDGDGICDNRQARICQEKCANFVDGNGDGVCDNCKGKGNCCPGQNNCCKNGGQKGNCQGMKPGCCGKGKGHQHRHGCNETQQPTTPESGKK